ncbi:MAG: hypothetical protein PHO26_09915 [Dehalococcoidia bacterium]|nr:hypothetical protein [Dehalococcoidia bacterium]MDD5494164.1 hypothetical protein [Dehalococcoidia bacterium]
MYNNNLEEHRSYDLELLRIANSRRRLLFMGKILQLYVLAGLFCGAIALGLLLVKPLQNELTHWESAILIIAGTGIYVSLISALVLYFRKNFYSTDIDLIFFIRDVSRFLNEWTRLENIVPMPPSSNRLDSNTFRKIIKGLVMENKISPEDARLLEEGMRFRNNLVHNANQVDATIIPRITDTIARITNKLES